MTRLILGGPVLPAEEGTVARRVVLRKIGSNYVTHIEGTDAEGRVSYAWGHYFTSVRDACADYYQRVKELS